MKKDIKGFSKRINEHKFKCLDDLRYAVSLNFKLCYDGISLYQLPYSFDY